MIKGCNNENLCEKDIDEKYYLFYQVWKELTETKTLDTYQYKMMNTLSALQELIEVIEQRLKQYVNNDSNINACKSEAGNIIAEDKVLLNHYPTIRNALLRYLNEKSDTGSKQRALLLRIKHYYDVIRVDYLKNLLYDLEFDIIQGNDVEIINKTDQLVSNCVYIGWSVLALQKAVDILHGSKTDSAKWNSFKNKLISTEMDEYKALIKFSPRYHSNKGYNIEKIKNEMSEMSIFIKKGYDLIESYSFLNNKLKRNSDYAVLDINAFDYYTASHKAISTYSNVLNIFSFYNIIEAWNMQDISITVVNTNNSTWKTLNPNAIYKTYDYIDGANKRFKISKNIYNSGSDKISLKLISAYSYANLGKASYSQEEKFINNWVALESLCRSQSQDSIINCILAYVPPAICLKYMFRLFRNFIEDCIRCNLTFENLDSRLAEKSTNKRVAVESIITILKDDSKYAVLYSECEKNHLLKVRCEELHNMIKEPKIMFEKITKHYTNVERQLRRLYRLRNKIAHSALQSSISLVMYIEHLSDYLSTLVSEIVMYYDETHVDDLNTILEIIKDNYNAFCDIKNSWNKNNNVPELLNNLCKTGIISLIK